MPVSNHISVYTTSEKEEKPLQFNRQTSPITKRKNFAPTNLCVFLYFSIPPSNYAFYSRLNIPFLKMGHFSVANWCICKIEVHLNQIDQSNLSHNLKQSYYITINEQNTTYCVIFVTTINLMAIKLTAIKIAIIWSSTTERKKWRYCMQLKSNHKRALALL